MNAHWKKQEILRKLARLENRYYEPEADRLLDELFVVNQKIAEEHDQAYQRQFTRS